MLWQGAGYVSLSNNNHGNTPGQGEPPRNMHGRCLLRPVHKVRLERPAQPALRAGINGRSTGAERSYRSHWIDRNARCDGSNGLTRAGVSGCL